MDSVDKILNALNSMFCLTYWGFLTIIKTDVLRKKNINKYLYYIGFNQGGGYQ